jgi:monoamine oxidase
VPPEARSEVRGGGDASGIGAGAVGVTALDAGDALQDAAIAQLVRLFGPAAQHPVACLIKDWATDPLVATTDDMQPLYAHPQYGRQASPPGEWAGCLILGGTESAPTYGGYMEGALEAGETAVAAATCP